MKTDVLTYGNLIVRSSAVEKRRYEAEKNQLTISKAVYRFSGITSEIMSVFNKEYSGKPSDDNGIIEFKECPAVFYDQTPYMFIISFEEDDDVTTARVFSPIAALCESADWDEKTRRLTIPVNFGNDLGEFEICWEWEDVYGNRKAASIRSQVYSTKLDIYSHFIIMMEEVKNRFNWIQLDLLRQTSWGWSHDNTEDKTLKTWLLIFQEVRTNMGFRLKKLITHHRKRLLIKEEYRTADKIRKAPRYLEEKISEGLISNISKKYSVEKKFLSADTPENRYIKHLFFHTYNQLNNTITLLKDNERISDIYKQRLQEWSDEWSMLKQHRFWRGIGEYHGLRKESQILSQDSLYSGIRRSWYLLQHGLKLLENDLRGGIQNAAQLYEIWCLLKIEEIIRDNGWNLTREESIDISINDEMPEISDEDLYSGSARLIYKKDELEDVELHVLFQPAAGPRGNSSKSLWENITSYPVSQRPDIVLRLLRKDLPGRPFFTWIFDAKYRIKDNLAPEDAVNQMHRYRDAILWEDRSTGNLTEMYREGIGAYVLYPGREDELNNKSQLNSVGLTNIGAYPLRPESKEYKPEYLSKKISYFLRIPEKEKKHIVQDKKTSDYGINEYALCTTRTHMRNPDYWKKCRLYRLPASVIQDDIKNPVKWKYLVPSFQDEHFGFYPVKNIKLLTRKEIVNVYKSEGIYIDHKPNKDDSLYYLFFLDEPVTEFCKIEPLPENLILKYIY